MNLALDLTTNQQISSCWKEYQRIKTDLSGDAYYKAQADLNKHLMAITIATGAISVMSKQSILRLCAMQSSYRFMALHSFLIYLSKPIEP